MSRVSWSSTRSTVNLFMPGLWQVKLAFILPEQGTDEVIFSFCVDP